MTSNFEPKINEVQKLIEKALSIVEAELIYNPDNKIIKEIRRKLNLLNEKCLTKVFQISVMALVKAGKSTFINALLGNEFLPTSNVPETSRIVRIKHNINIKEALLRDTGDLLYGRENIYDYLKNLNAISREKNEQPLEDELILETNLVSLSNKELKGIQFELVDTPGPNEAGAEKLKIKVEGMLDDSDVIIYLLDYQKLKTNEDEELIQKLLHFKKDILNSDRLFFLINKIDVENSRDGLTPDKAVDYVYNFLVSRNIPIKDSSQIYTMSSEYALLSRAIQSNNPKPEVIKDFAKKVFGFLGENKRLEECLPYALEVLNKSNLPTIESAILSYIYENRAKILLGSIIEGINGEIVPILNHFATANASIQSDMQKLSKSIVDIQNDIKETKKNLKQIDSKAISFEKQLVDWIERKFTDLEIEAINIIEYAFEGKNATLKTLEKTGNLNFVDVADAGFEIVEIWMPALGKFFKKAINQVSESITYLLKNAKDQSKPEIEKMIKNVNKELETLFANTFNAFRYDLEKEVVDKQVELFKEFQLIVNSCKKEIELRIGKKLDIQLKESPVSFPPYQLGQIHSKIEDFISEQEEEMTIRGGWCTRSRIQKFTVFSISKNEFKKHWIKYINEMTRVSTISGRKIVNKNIQSIIDEARSKFEDYAEGYMSNIRREEIEKQKGSAEKENRQNQIAERMKEVEEILFKLRTI